MSLAERPDPVPGPGEVLVDLIAAALNRRDWWIRRGGKVPLPQVLGSDGAGVVSAVGPEVEGVAVGDEVVLYPGRNWGPSEAAPGADFEILGVPSQGTYAERICVRYQIRPSAARGLELGRDGGAAGRRADGVAGRRHPRAGRARNRRARTRRRRRRGRVLRADRGGPRRHGARHDLLGGEAGAAS